MAISKSEINVHKCEWHRNGISGVGFFTIEFDYMEDGKNELAIATVSSKDFLKFKDSMWTDVETRVLMYKDDGSGLIDISRTMRGDYFHTALCKWIIENENKK